MQSVTKTWRDVDFRVLASGLAIQVEHNTLGQEVLEPRIGEGAHLPSTTVWNTASCCDPTSLCGTVVSWEMPVRDSFRAKVCPARVRGKIDYPLLLYFDYGDVSLYTFSPRRLHLGIVLCTKSEVFEDWIITCIDGQYVAPGRWEGVKGNVEGTDL